VLISRAPLTVGYQIEQINFRRPETRDQPLLRMEHEELADKRMLKRSAELDGSRSRQRPECQKAVCGLSPPRYHPPRRTGNDTNHSAEDVHSPPNFRSLRSCRPGYGVEGSRNIEPIICFPVSYHKLVRSPIYVILYGSTQYTVRVPVTTLYYFTLKSTESAALRVVVECRHIDA